MESTELFNGQSFEIGPVLPEIMRSHCITWINNTHLFLTGGMVSSPGKSNRAYVLDTTLDPLVWQPVAPMQNARYGHTCQVVGQDRKQIVVRADRLPNCVHNQTLGSYAQANASKMVCCVAKLEFDNCYEGGGIFRPVCSNMPI